jgi:hypothetical protein
MIMKFKSVLSISLMALAVAVTTLRAVHTERAGIPPAPAAGELRGHYLEVRSCDVYTGPCFANAETGLSGKEGMLVWSVTKGSWQGTALDGLSVIAAIKTDATLGDMRYQPRRGRAVLIVDARADSEQRRALVEMARARGGELLGEVARVTSLPIESTLGACDQSGCARVKAGSAVEIVTRCLGGKDHLCGNEDCGTRIWPSLFINGAVMTRSFVRLRARRALSTAAAMAVFAAGVALGNGALAAAWSVQTVEQAVPAGVDASIRSVLAQDKAVQALSGGKPVYTLWFRSEVPLKSKPSSVSASLKSVGETTLLGVVQVASAERDYRDDQLFSGLYTIRFSFQPQDGNHLGTADYPYFAVLTPAKLDPQLEGLATYKELVKASSRESATDHPFVLSLRPVAADEGAYPRITEPAANHKCVRVKLVSKADGAETALVFDLVVEGVAIH